MIQELRTVYLIDKNASYLKSVLTSKFPSIQFEIGSNLIEAKGHYGVITFSPGSLINNFSDAIWVHCTGAGIDQLIDVMDFEPKWFTRTVGKMGNQIGEYVLAYCLLQTQKILIRKQLQDKKEWHKENAMPTYLFSKSALIFGTGEIGKSIAKMLSKMGVRCTGVSRTGKTSSEFYKNITVKELKNQTLSEYDFVVAALPNTKHTKGLLNRNIFEQLKGALFINVGRGQTVSEKDILDALRKGNLESVVLDVFESEPLSSTSKLWKEPNCIITPHVSGVTIPNDAAQAFMTAYKEIASGKVPSSQVNLHAGY